MKVHVTYKTPDAVHFGVVDALADVECTPEERRTDYEDLNEAVLAILGSDEYLTVIIDTEEKSVTFKKPHR